MSANPKRSIDALFPKPIDVGFGVKVFPLTLAHYALLEKMHSYVVDGNHLPDGDEVLKTYYVCTHPADEVFADFEDLDVLAYDWASRLPPELATRIAEAIKSQIDAMAKVVPALDESKKKLHRGTDF